MGYIITATFAPDMGLNDKNGLEEVLKNDFVRHLSTDYENRYETVDIKGDFDKTDELTLKLCDALVKAGIRSFEVAHSY